MRRGRSFPTRPGVISQETRVHTVIDSIGLPIFTWAAFWKEGDLETAFLPSCNPLPTRLKHICFTARFADFELTGVPPLTATLQLKVTSSCGLPVAVVKSWDILDAFQLNGFAFNCVCFEADFPLDGCDLFLWEIVLTGSSVAALLARLTSKWETR